jgi:hypothetical protein
MLKEKALGLQRPCCKRTASAALGVCLVSGEVTEVTALQRNDHLSGRHDNGAWIGSTPTIISRQEVHV